MSAWSKILIANVHLPLLDCFKDVVHSVADVLPVADSACPIVIDTPTIRLRNIDNIEIVKTMLCKATTAILYSSLIAKGYNSLTDRICGYLPEFHNGSSSPRSHFHSSIGQICSKVPV